MAGPQALTAFRTAQAAGTLRDCEAARATLGCILDMNVLLLQNYGKFMNRKFMKIR
jgi:hypothetical protein